MNIEKDLLYVKDKGIRLIEDQAKFHRRLSDQNAGSDHPKDKDKSKMHSKRAAAWGEFSAILLGVTKHLDANPSGALSPGEKSSEPPAFLRIGDIDSLPEELLNQIKMSDSDKLDMDIIKCFDDFGGTAAIDEILVQLWKITDTIHDRDYLARKIYRLTRNGTLKSITRKGYFTTDLSYEASADQSIDEEDDESSI